MKVLIIVPAIIIPVVAITILAASYVEWYSSYKPDKSEQSISFEQFYNLYNICPDKWQLKTNYVMYCCTVICFESYIDYIKYLWFRTDIIHKLELEEYSKARIPLIKSWQSDIDEYRKKYQADLDELKKKIN